MFRGTTPTFTFTLQFDTSEIDDAFATFAQSGTIVIDKGLSDMEKDGRKLRVKLSQEETLRLKGNSGVEIQLAVRIGSNVMRSKIMTTTVNRILKEAEL